MVSFSAPLARRLWKGRTDVPLDSVHIERRDPHARVPLALAQEPMWFTQEVDPGNSTFNAYEAFVLLGTVDAFALQSALDEIVRRHEILRTAFRLVDGEPSQVVLPDGAFPLEVVERRDLTSRTVELDALLEAFVRRPFGFSDATMARALLVRLRGDESVLVLAMHHLVRDGWSIGVLLDEISRLCAGAEQSDAALAPLPIQYGDYAIWQRALVDGGAFDAQRAYWADRLGGASFVMELPSDRPRGQDERTTGGVCSIGIDPSVVTGLRTFAADAHASFFMVLMAAFQTFVHRYTGSSDVLTGFPVSGRATPQTESQLGCFTNTVVLRTQFERSATFRDVVARVRVDALDAYDNQDYPIEKLIEDLRPERRPGMNPLIQTLVTRIDPRRPALRLPGVEVERLTLRIGRPKVDLALEMIDEPDGSLTCFFEYADALFEEAMVVRMLEHFGILVAAAARDPDVPVDDLPLISGAERETLLHRWNPPLPAPSAQLAHELFESWVARTPNALALQAGSQTLTYTELNRRAERLAGRLRSAGAAPNAIVGIYLDRSIELIVAQLAVLKAGAAYLPLDPSYPAARIAFMVEDAGAIAVVTDSPSANAEAIRGLPAVLVDDGTADIGEPIAAAQPTAADLAYVIYTSGTTGMPKGAMIEHCNAVAYIEASIPRLGFTSRDRILQFSATSFDGSIIEIWGAFASGATLVLRNDPMIGSPSVFLKTCADWHITVLAVSAGYWNELVSAIAAGDAVVPPSLRTMIAAGETMSMAHVVRWKHAVGETPTLVNAYGPTEATVVAAFYDVPPLERLDTSAPVSIGRPLANARCYILDQRGAPVPIGVPGEITIGGASVGRGYVGDDTLTAARFVCDPFGPPGSRMYRTGDRGRFRPDGTIEFLGRLDRQVKLRGFRVEPGEIENALLQHPAVRAAVVIDVADPTGAIRLAAFVTTDAPVAELRAFASAALPPHMVPASIIPVDTIPLTPERKTDRAALRALAANAAATETSFVKPARPVEYIVAQVWGELLGTRIGLDDDFFALGGHSLQAASMVGQLNERFGVTIPLRRLFGARSVRALSDVVEEAQRAAAAGSSAQESGAVLQLQAGGPRVPFFFLHGDYTAGGLYSARIAEALGRDQPFFIVQPHGVLEDERPCPVEAMAQKRVRAIRAMQPHGPYLLGGYCLGGVVAYEIARTLAAEGEEVPLVVLLDAPRGLQRFSWLKRAIHAAAALLRWSRERELRTYLRWRHRVWYYRQATVRERIDWLRGTLLRENGASELNVTNEYLAAIERYAPGPYAGRLLMINSTQDGRAERGAHTDWSPLAPNATIHAIDADHDALVRDHALAIGRRIRQEIDQTMSMETRGLEPLTSYMQSRRSTS